MRMIVERNGKEYTAIQYTPDSECLCHLTELDVVFEYTVNELDESVMIDNNWYVTYGDYIIVKDSEIYDVRSPAAFAKMYDIISMEDFTDEEEETITFKIQDLKDYILSLKTEKDEYWCSEQELVADEFSNFFNYLGVKGSRTFNKFVNQL